MTKTLTPAWLRRSLCLGVLFGLFGLFWGCSGAASWPKVLDPTDIAFLRQSRPTIRRVRDLGNVHIGNAGPLLAESDGLFTVGELVLIEGGGFGKQPTVTLGGRPAEVLWRAEGGGVIVRLPEGTPIGPQTLSLQNGDGNAQTPVTVRRLGLILATRHGQLHALEIGGGPGSPPALRTPVNFQPLSIPGARRLAISGNGAAAYVLMGAGNHDRVAIVDLLAPGGPRIFDTRELTHHAHLVVTSERAGAVAFVGDEYVTLWDAREARRPSPWQAVQLPTEARGAKAAAMDPTGTLLALALPEGNRVVLVDIKPGTQSVKPELLAQVEALPLARQPLLTDLRFASDGATVWVLSGDNPQSFAAGHQPTRLIALHVGPSEAGTQGGRTQREVKVERTLDLPDAGAPVRLALGRAPPVASGASIRTPPEKAALYFTAVAPEALGGGEPTGALLHADPSGGTQVVYAGSELLGGVDLTPDAVVALCASLTPGRQGLSATAAHIESHATVTLPLGPTDEGDRRPPYTATDVSVQP